jgi:hypothetical protein
MPSRKPAPETPLPDPDDVLRVMLHMPPKPHVMKPAKPKKPKKPKVKKSVG